MPSPFEFHYLSLPTLHRDKTPEDRAREGREDIAEDLRNMSERIAEGLRTSVSMILDALNSGAKTGEEFVGALLGILRESRSKEDESDADRMDRMSRARF